jgi:uncharacterized protein (TIGR02588 family)
MTESKNAESMLDEKKLEKRTVAEWITLGIATVILSTIAGSIGYSWITKSSESAILNIKTESPIRKANGKFYVPFLLRNEGGETAESVQAIAELKIKGKVEESGEQTIDFLSSGEDVRGAFVFSQNPDSGELTLRIGSYQSP